MADLMIRHSDDSQAIECEILLGIHEPLPAEMALHSPVFAETDESALRGLRAQFAEACRAWLARSTSEATRSNYARDIGQFLAFVNIPADELDRLAAMRPGQVAAWRDTLLLRGLTNSSVRRKMTALRSLFSYLKNWGYAGANPAHSDFVAAPAVPRDGKTVGLTPAECRRLMESPKSQTPAGIRDRAIIALLAYSACRVGELAKLRVGDYQSTGGHRVLQIMGKGGKERRVPLHPEACERLEAWLDMAGIRRETAGPLFRPGKTARGTGKDGFRQERLSKRAVQRLVRRYVRLAGLDPSVTVHSLRVTALTTARERGSDVIDLQEFAGHSDPRTTLAYIRNRDRLAKSPAYVLKY
jgi:integrase/recombinase XerD